MHFLMTSAWDYRAHRAYLRAGAKQGIPLDQPTRPDTYLDDQSGRRYVVLYSQRGLLSIFRVTTSGTLKRLKRYPAALRSLYD